KTSFFGPESYKKNSARALTSLLPPPLLNGISQVHYIIKPCDVWYCRIQEALDFSKITSFFFYLLCIWHQSSLNTQSPKSP
ncbi:hypothetical protein P7L93_24555, partial [Vibrio parahaemolyticus]|nr:hypothetical protein [Vibrio parahaemolyticus]